MKTLRFGLVALMVVSCFLSSSDALAKKRKKKAKPSLKARLIKQYKIIAATNLEPWDHENSSVVTEKGAKGYKIVKPDGSVAFEDKIPTSPQGIAKLYVRRNPSGFHYVITKKGRQFVWNRLYWSPKSKSWQPSDPKSSAYIVENARVREFLFRLNKHYDNKAAYRLPVLVSQLKSLRLKEGTRKKYTAELRQLTQSVGGTWGGANLLDAIYDINIKLPTASVEDKVKLALKRRSCLKQIIPKVKE